MEMKKIDWFLLYVTIVIGITCLRLSNGYPLELVQFLNGFVELAENMITYFGLTKIYQILQQIPIKWILLLTEGFEFAVGFLILFLFRPQWEQGTMLLLKKGGMVIKTGIALYVMLFAIICIFIYSVVGLPIGTLFLLVQHIAISLGYIPIAVFFGYLLLQQFQIKGEIYLYYMIGTFVMLLFKNVSLIGGAFLFFVFPVLALGVDMLLFIYHFIYQCSFPVEFQEEKKFNRDKIRDIIKKDMERR